MEITVLMGSPNKKGSTSILVDSFKRGAEESGHEVDVIDVCHADVNPCIGCVKCGYEGPCVQRDDTRTIRAALLSADMGMVLGYGCGTPSMPAPRPTTPCFPSWRS